MEGRIQPAARARVIAGLVALGCVLGCNGDGNAGDRPRPNVLLISLDSTRRDLLSTYGHRPRHVSVRPTCPNIDELARSGVVMENAYATTSWTLPSHLSMFTGQPEVVHAVDIDYHRPDPSRPTMAQVLKAYGYRTAGFFSGPYLEPHFGFDRGFDRYEACYGPRLMAASEQSLAARTQLEAAQRRGDPTAIRAAMTVQDQAQRTVESESHRDVSSRSVTDATIAAIEAAAEEQGPFFVFAHYFDPHYDYVPPAPHDTSFDPGYGGAIDGGDFYRNPLISTPDTSDADRPGLRKKMCSDRDLEHVRALYAGELEWTDAEIGRILRRLDELGLTDDTLVIVTADHGDEFFEHGSLGHRLTLYEEVVQIPLILRLPGRLPAGGRVAGLVSTVDILPTCLELLGLKRMSSLASHSFVPLIEGDENGDERAVFGRIVRTFGVTLSVPSGRIGGQLVRVLETYRTGSIKITRERRWPVPANQISPQDQAHVDAQRRRQFEEERLRWIDLDRHPGEEAENHSTDFEDARVRAALQEFHDRYEELLAKRGRAELSEQDDDLFQRLRGLGYVDLAPGTEPISSDEFTLPPPGKGVLR